MIAALRSWASAIKRDAVALFLASRDARTPWLARILAIAVAAYALSPIDLIPDFIPILGYLDDLIILPLGIWAAIRLIPAPLFDEFRTAARAIVARPVSRAGAAFIVIIWIVCALALAAWAFVQVKSGRPPQS